MGIPLQKCRRQRQLLGQPPTTAQESSPGALSEETWRPQRTSGVKKKQKTSVSDGEGRAGRGGADRLQQEESGYASKDGMEKLGDAERQEEEGNTGEEEDAEKQEQEGRGDTRKEEDRERRCDGEKQRARSDTGREGPDTRKPCHVPGGTWLHKVQSYFLTGSPIKV
ncbi:hypothetical protein NDU88_004351 [Pleurodeles waltl]|uniref:Uncharacterized protein n=1 Tax=Pleurodeles waltl TaxID=8319 RepID=A0AAV7VJQ1_PLEWA|nr:hypothetical protein NDU88_004351 [Pleurodeles waltl]